MESFPLWGGDHGSEVSGWAVSGCFKNSRAGLIIDNLVHFHAVQGTALDFPMGSILKMKRTVGNHRSVVIVDSRLTVKAGGGMRTRTLTVVGEGTGPRYG